MIIKKPHTAHAARKQPGKTLGAVKLRDETESQLGLPRAKATGPVGAEEDCGAATCTTEKVAKITVDVSPMSRFQHELAETGTTEKWFEEQIAVVQQRREGRDFAPAAGRDSATKAQPRSIQESIKQHLSDMVKGGGSDPRYGLETLDLSTMVDGDRAVRDPGSSILDIGLDAIQKVGQTWVDIATTVDSTIEQWFDSFHSIDQMSDESHASASDDESSETFEAPSQPALSFVSTVPRSESARGSRKTTNSQKRSPGLRYARPEGEEEALKRLQDEMRRKEAEFYRVQEEVKRLKAELSYTSNKVQSLNEENTILRCAPETHCSPIRASSSEEPDPITDLMAQQLATLLTEKAKLAQDNARLARENDTLHDILSISMTYDDEDDLLAGA